MKSLSRAFFVWITLGGCSWSLVTGGHGDLAGPVAGSVLLVLLSTAIWLTAIAASGDRPASYGMTLISTITVVAWGATLVVVEGRIEAHPDEKQTLLITCGLATLLAVGVVVKTRLYPRWSTLRGMTITLAIPAFAGAIFLWRYEAKTKSIAARAEARWSEIGMSLSELEKTLVMKMGVQKYSGKFFEKKRAASFTNSAPARRPGSRRLKIRKAPSFS